MKALISSMKFKRFHDQLGLSEQARVEATKVIVDISEKQHEGCMMAKGVITRSVTEGSNKITFSEADMEVPYIHNRPLYMIVMINGLEARRTFIDNGASVNIMPLSTLRHLGIPEKKLGKK